MKRIIAALVIVLVAWPTSAALDSERRRGSAINLGIPGRPWTTWPDGGFSHNDRLSLLGYASNVTELPPIHYYYHTGGAE
jgi:hypothetical protein